MKELIEYIAVSVVSNPEEVKVTETIESDDRIVISLEVHPEDKGKIIGRQGQFARAMRSILKVLAIKRNVRVTLEII
ncbi:MAG: RNA-binding protein [Chloroflexi bacterium]|nr:RNA-binding protein [Chloroflexota bacterium]|tara:strand:- start:577 stop:807 length:231 start_codon:yes stop_codon:yes gene_type:complete